VQKQTLGEGETECSFDAKLCREYSYQKLSQSGNWFSSYSRKCQGCFLGTQCKYCCMFCINLKYQLSKSILLFFFHRTWMHFFCLQNLLFAWILCFWLCSCSLFLFHSSECCLFWQIDQDRNDKRLYHPNLRCEITKYMEIVWAAKSQTR